MPDGDSYPRSPRGANGRSGRSIGTSRRAPCSGNLELRVFTPDEKYSFEFGGAEVGPDWTRSSRCGGGRLGRWEFGFDWDQTPHLLLHQRAVPRHGDFAPASSRCPRRGRRWQRTTRPRKWTIGHALGRGADVSSSWPRPRTSTSSRSTHGHTSTAIALSRWRSAAPAITSSRSFDPIDQTVHDFRIKGTWAREQWQLQFGYTLLHLPERPERGPGRQPLLRRGGARRLRLRRRGSGGSDHRADLAGPGQHGATPSRSAAA